MVYHLYGVRLHSDWRLPYSRAKQPFVTDITLRRRASRWFAAARQEAAGLPQPWPPIVEGELANGSTYLQWPNRFEFLISANGRQIAANPLCGGTPEGFHTHLLGQALSFALIRQGLDPLHGTVVTVDGRGAAFLGYSGYGKSSLAAAFIGAGHRLLTDDLLVLTEHHGALAAHPGPPRLKLYPAAARRLLPGAEGVPIMRSTPKLLFRLRGTQVTNRPTSLRAVYVLAPPDGRRLTRVTIRRLSERQACLALIRNTFNASVLSPTRLAQQLTLSASLATTVPVKSISYPRSFRALASVRDAILADLDRESRAS